MIRLCSASPSRAKILQDFGVEFIQVAVDFDEDSIKSKDAKGFAYKSALGKFDVAKDMFGDETPILTADSVVCCEDKILRKAKDKDDAKKMLLLQSDNLSSVYSCVFYSFKGALFTNISITTYLLGEFMQNDLDNYLNSNIWQKKAGAMTVEYFFKPYIKKQVGLTTNAMGLPIERVLPFIQKS